MLPSLPKMKAMLLAAGFGERMLPLTRIVPKPVLPVLGRPLAELVLHRLSLGGISTVVVNLHHQADKIRSLLGDGRDLGLSKLHYSFEEVILGTAGGVRKAAPYLRGGETILVRNADFLSDADLNALTAVHLASGCPVTLLLAPHRPPYTVVEVDEAGKVLSFGGNPPVEPARVAARRFFTGMQIIEEEVLDRIPPDTPCDLVRHVYRQLAAERRIASHVHEGFWCEFGTPGDYLDGSLAMLQMNSQDRLAIAKMDPVERIGEARVAIGPGAEFHNAVDLRGRIALGFASLVAEGTRLEDTIVMPEAWIGPGCELRRAIVGPETEVPAGFRGENVVLCADTEPDAPLPAETVREGGLLVRRFADRYAFP